MLKTLLAKLTLPHDKLSHFFYGVVTALIMLPLFSHWFIMCYILLFSLAKEIWDSYNGGGVECLDLLATVAGSFCIILARII